ncbi:uncharacterized protein LOC134279369 [Saccostrea cucullata]|uniref:uncharacterized protein LOC134279369 n=1 Tax=Saccostrea cuccullata TaxID=36930 RepID=UPI002ED09BAB
MLSSPRRWCDFGFEMAGSEKLQDILSDFPEVTPIRAYLQDYTYNYSLRHTWFGDQHAHSRLSSQSPPDFAETKPNVFPKLQLDHLQFPPTNLSTVNQDPCNIKTEPYEYATSTEVASEYVQVNPPVAKFPPIKLEPNEFPTVNIRDLGSSILQLPMAEKSNSSDVPSRYLQNNPQLSLPLRQPLVDMTNVLESFDTGRSKENSQNERENLSRVPLSKYLPVLWKSVFDSQNTQSDLEEEEEKPMTDREFPKTSEGQERRVKRSRKLQIPVKSAQRLDPNFRGATVILHTEIKNKNCSLTLSAHFSNVKIYKQQPCRKRKHSGSYSNADSVSGSDEENTIPFPKDTHYSGKICASCGTHRTPLWRDADDGTPLCNACGIR